MAENSLLGKLDGLVSRFEEVGTLITDPAVIADMKRFVKLNKAHARSSVSASVHRTGSYHPGSA